MVEFRLKDDSEEDILFSNDYWMGWAMPSGDVLMASAGRGILLALEPDELLALRQALNSVPEEFLNKLKLLRDVEDNEPNGKSH